MPKKRPKREGIMLAYPAEEGRVKRLGKEFFMQPKLRGERARVEWFHGEPNFISSYGNEFKFLDHLKERMKEVAEDAGGHVPFDGELYVHGWSQQEISAILRSTVNKHPKTEQLEYHIFDICEEVMPQYKRLTWLADFVAQGVFGGEVQAVNCTLVNRLNWIDQVNKYLDYGYEGGILRAINLYWEPKRTVGMLKYKPTEEDEYTITSVNEAIDEAGSPKGMVGSFTVKGDDGTEFKVGAGKLIHERRISLWQERFELQGEILIVKHEPIKTKDGVPVCAVAVDLKEE